MSIKSWSIQEKLGAVMLLSLLILIPGVYVHLEPSRGTPRTHSPLAKSMGLKESVISPVAGPSKKAPFNRRRQTPMSLAA